MLLEKVNEITREVLINYQLAAGNGGQAAGDAFANAAKKITQALQLPAIGIGAIAIVCLGLSLFFGSERVKEVAKSKAAMIVVGAVLVALAPMIANWLLTEVAGNSGTNFNNPF